MKIARFVLFLLLCTAPAQAQTIDRDFKLVAGALILSTVFDMETTFAGIESGRAHEANPIMRPLVEHGRGGVYAVQLLIARAQGDLLTQQMAMEQFLSAGRFIDSDAPSVIHRLAQGASLRARRRSAYSLSRGGGGAFRNRHPTGEADAERTSREFQRKASRRVFGG